MRNITRDIVNCSYSRVDYIIYHVENEIEFKLCSSNTRE